MAEKKIIELEVKDNLGTLKQQLKEAKAEVQSLTQEFGATSAITAKAAEHAAELKLEIAEGNKLIKAFDPTKSLTSVTGALGGVREGIGLVGTSFKVLGGESKAVTDAIEKVGLAMELTSGISSIGESVASFKTLGTVIKATSVYQGIYNFIQGATSENLKEETIAKVLDTEATVAQGVAVVGTSTAMTAAAIAGKLLRAALIATGIGVFIALLGSLAANFDSIIGFFSGSTNANIKNEAAIKKNTKALDTQVKANERASTALKTKNGHEYNMAEASGASSTALHKLAIRHANEEIALERASKATAHNTYVKEKNTLAYYRNIGASDEVIAKQVALTKAAMENSIKEGKDLAAALENKAQLIRDNDVRIAGEKHSRSQKTHEKTTKTEKVNDKKIVETKTKQTKELLDITKNVEDENIRLMDEGQAKEEAVIKLAYKRKKEEQDKQLKEKVLKQADYDTLQILNTEGQEADLLAIQEKYTLQAEEARKTAQEKKDAEFFRQENLLAELTDTELQKLYDKYKLEQDAAEGNAELLLALEKKYNLDKQKIDDEAAAKVKEREKMLLDFKLNTALEGLQLITDISEMFGSKNEKQAKKAFNIQKAASIASTTIQTYQAAQSAYASQIIPGDPTSVVRGAIAAGLAVASGLVKVAKIAKTKFEGGGAGGGGGNEGGATTPTLSAPQFNVVGQSGVNQLASLNQQPIQAYVVSGQVTSQQALDRNRLENATLGG